MARETWDREKKLEHLEYRTQSLYRHMERLGFPDVGGALRKTAVSAVEASVLSDKWFAKTTYLNADVEGAWATEVSLIVQFKPDTYLELGIRAEIEIGWSSTHRSISNATTAVALYQQAIVLASIIENVINR